MYSYTLNVAPLRTYDDFLDEELRIWKGRNSRDGIDSGWFKGTSRGRAVKG